MPEPSLSLTIIEYDLKVLKTIPWDLVDIEMISVETDLAGLVMEGSRCCVMKTIDLKSKTFI